jgi:DeoR family transcriptional regulator, aga operon transcriptional repressor
MLNEERRRAILEIIESEGRALVTQLAPRLEASQFTIRNYLNALHREGLIHRTHGGALPVRPGALSDPGFRSKDNLKRREKERIGRAAAKLIKRDQSIVLDSGTTTMAIARALHPVDHLTVITATINIAAQLSGSSVDVVLTGGVLRENSLSLVGPVAEETLRRFTADIAFLGVDGFDARFGLTSPNISEARIKQVMVDIARRTVLVCDSSKFGRRFLSVVVPPAKIHQVITDTKIPRVDRKFMEDAGIEVTIV